MGDELVLQALGRYMDSHAYMDVSELISDFESKIRSEQSRTQRCVEFVETFRKKRDGDEAPDGGDGNAAKSEAVLEKEQVEIKERIQELEGECGWYLTQLEKIDEEEHKLEKLEQGYWREFYRLYDTYDRLGERSSSLVCQTDLLTGCRNALKQTNVLNDAFCIWYDGPFGIISGLRLGKLPEVAVEWSEINAAWGQVALLLATLARQVHFSFSKYRIIPMGSTSKLVKVGSENTRYELYCTGGFFKSSFNNAMVCILHCVQELGEYAEKTDRVMKLPYSIDGDKIGGLSVRTGSSDANWTRALKNFLTDLKWLVAWSTKRQRFG